MTQRDKVMPQRIDMTGFIVNDMSKIVAFYDDILGFDVVAAGDVTVYTSRDASWGNRSPMIPDPEDNLFEIISWNKDKKH